MRGRAAFKNLWGVYGGGSVRNGILMSSHGILSLKRGSDPMAAKLTINLKDPLKQRCEAFCEKFPLFSMVMMQAAMAVAMLAAVAAIALRAER